MNPSRIVIAGGGAAGVFAAIACAEARTGAEVVLLEKSAQGLAKVKISGGGRCNVTHAGDDPRELARHYPRGGPALIGALGQFSPRDTVAWFAVRGVALKTERDGRLFPVTDSSQTIVNCLLDAARAAGVQWRLNCGLERATHRPGGGFELHLSTGETLTCDRLLLATGGCRTAAAGQVAVALGHQLEPPVPSLFTFRVDAPWLRGLAGVTAEVEVSVAAVRSAKLCERGPLLITHWGLSGPAILQLSAWGARWMSENNYQFPLLVNWLPEQNETTLAAELASRRQSQPSRRVVQSPIAPLTARLWAQLTAQAGVAADTRWAALGRPAAHRLIQQLRRTELAVTGKSLNQDEFVTCGGVRLAEVDFKTMQSRLCPGLFFAGEILDVDGLTGGFNFQAAWTTGWLAAKGLLAAKERKEHKE